MPKKDGLQVVTELMSRAPRPRVIVLTSSEKPEDLRRSLTAGVKGYILKGTSRGKFGIPFARFMPAILHFPMKSPQNWQTL